jgi:putative hydrolase of the HAD superfamily
MRGIIFDLDDTLYPRDVFVQSGFEAVATHVADSWRRSREGLLATLRRAHTGGFEHEEFQVLCTEHRLPLSAVPMLVKIFRAHRPSIVLQPAVRRVLQRLRRDGWRLAILTNGDPDLQRRKIEALGLSQLVHCVLYAEQYVACGKPHPEAFRAAANELHVPRSRCVHVGDDPECDVAGARAAGLRAIRVLSPPDWTLQRDEAQCAWQSTDADATVDTVLDVASVAPLVLPETRRVV